MIVLNCKFSKKFDWPATVEKAWQYGEEGNYSGARLLYEIADDALPEGSLAPQLCLKRHGCQNGHGQVVSIPPTEDVVHSLFLPGVVEEKTIDGLGSVLPPDVDWDRALANFTAMFPPVEQSGRQHIFVMSTGRCGTVSLSRLFDGSNYQPYHSYWFMPNPVTVFEFICRLNDSNFDDISCVMNWMKCRVAEWAGTKPAMLLNHRDTFFAPVFASLFPEAKFIWLRRDDKKVRKSFINKAQMGSNAQPIHYALNGDFRWKYPDVCEEIQVDWFIRNTNSFARTMKRMVGNRCMEISSDRLFDQDLDEIAKLLAFTDNDINLKDATDHFGVKINEKKHKVR